MNVWNEMEFDINIDKVEKLWLNYSILFDALEYSNKTKKIKYTIKIFVLQPVIFALAAKNILF